MLRGIPDVLSPELLKVLCEMGHGDRLIIADAFYPSCTSARHNMLVRADGIRATTLLDAILQFFPLDGAVEFPVLIMDTMECDKGKVATPIWDEYIEIVEKYDPRGKACVGYIERFDFYKAAEGAYAILATGEKSLYGDIIIQKGTI